MLSRSRLSEKTACFCFNEARDKKRDNYEPKVIDRREIIKNYEL